MQNQPDSTPIRGPLVLSRAGELAAPTAGAECRVCTRLGSALRCARESRHLTQAQLAVAAGLSQTSVCDIEQGRCDCRVSHLVLMCRALDVSAAWLLKCAA